MMKLFKAQDNSSIKITVFWGDIFYDSAVCHPHSSITVGRKPGSTFLLDLGPSSSGENLELIKVLPNKCAELQFNDDIEGHVRFEKEVLPLQVAKTTNHATKDDKGIYHIRLSEKDKADIVIGHVSFYVDWVHEKHIIRRSDINKKAAFIAFALLLPFLFLPKFLDEAMENAEPDEKPPERLVTLIRKTPPPAKAAAGERKTETGGAEKGDLGKAKVVPPPPPTAAEILRKANLGNLVSGLSSLGSNTSAPKVAVNGEKSKGGTITGSVPTEGTSGFSTEGLKTGGGGKSVGIGRTVGQGQGGFEGTGRLGLSGNSIVEGGTGHGTQSTITEGGLDREVIDSIVRKRQEKIRLCYERQLNFYPKLSGKVTVQFVIGKTGSVLSSDIVEDTMKNSSVKNCLLAEVREWSFPPPTGGTLVKVDYPFVFESSAKGSN